MKLKPERWQEIDKVFQAALERDPNERARFLNHACASDPSLRSEVEALLSAHEQAGSFIQSPVFEAAPELIADSEASALVGTMIGPYKINSFLGAGGMGEVYLAQDTRLGRKVALKLLPDYFVRDEQRLRRFKQEARAASALNHPNIITIFEIGQSDSIHYFATEYVRGETLKQRISCASMNARDAIDVAIQIATALAAAHEAGIVHRDIKPENIMLRPDGYVKVLDFGLAKLTLSRDPASTDALTVDNVITEPGIVMGTVNYMSPEQTRGLKVDARTDIWSLGVVLYEMVAGHVPFKGETTNDMIAAILNAEAPFLTTYAPDVPAELERIVTKALRKDREQRYQVIEDMIADLKSLKQRLDFKAELKRGEQPGDEMMRQATRGAHSADGTLQTAPAQTGAKDIRTSSNVEHAPVRITRRNRVALLILAPLLAATIAVACLYYFSSSGTSDISSIAVMPFTNISHEPDVEYLSDGISESLINRLSQLPGVKVIARSSAFKYKGKEIDPKEVAQALSVGVILTGRVAQRGENLLVSVELMNTRDGTQMWGEQYNRVASDLLMVQAEISREIAEKLRLRLTAGDKQQLAKRETANPAAYELLLKGRYYWRKGGNENKKKAAEFFSQAIAVDPNYALAYAAQSEIYWVLVGDSILDPKEFTPRAEAAARQALELDANLADAHFALANIELDGWNWAAAEHEYKRAIELNPNLARAYFGYSGYLSVMGRHEQAIVEMKRARDLDPISLAANARVGVTRYMARQYEEAIDALKKTLELDQSFPDAYAFLGYAYTAKQMYAEAIASYQEVIKLGSDSPSVQIYMGAAYAKAGEREKAQAIAKRLEASDEYVSPGEMAILYGALGELDQAMASLEKAYAAHDLQLQFIGVDPAFDPIRQDPRFQALMRRIGLID